MQKNTKRIVYSFLSTFILLFMIQISFTYIEINIPFLSPLYRQTNYDSSHFDLIKLVSFYAFYFNIYACYHPNKIFKRFKTKNFKYILYWFAISLIAFFFSQITVLLGFYDYEHFCTGSKQALFNFHKEDGTIGYQIFLSMQDVNRSFTFKSFYQNIIPFLNEEVCLYPGFIERLFYYFWFLMLPGYIYLSIFPSYLQKRYLVNITTLKTLQAYEIILLVLIFTHVVCHFVFFFMISIICFLVYLIVYIVILVGLSLLTKKYYSNKNFVVDKYLIAYLLIPISCLHCGLDCCVLTFVLCSVLVEKKNKGSFFRFWEDNREIKVNDVNISLDVIS